MGNASNGSVGSFPGKGRIETLTDGIFAIAMTLLVLDIRVPMLPKEITAVGLEHRAIRSLSAYRRIIVIH
jgi:uncharacterized membrane protein